MRGLRRVRLTNEANFYLWCFMFEEKKKHDDSSWDGSQYASLTLLKALASLEKHEFEITSGAQAKQLNGVGDKTAKKITKWLNQKNQLSSLQLKAKFEKFGGDYEGYKELTKQKKRKKKNDDGPPKKRKKRSDPSKPKKKAKPYRPRYRTGPWAILVGLRGTEEFKFWTKKQVIAKCQPYSNASFTEMKIIPGQPYGYTAWSSVNNTLVNKGLLMKHTTSRALFSLSEKGRKLAEELWHEHLEKSGHAESESGEENQSGFADFKDSSFASDFYQHDYGGSNSDVYQQNVSPHSQKNPSPPPKPQKPFVRRPGQWDVIEDFGLPPPGVQAPKLQNFYNKKSISEPASFSERPASSFAHLNLPPARPSSSYAHLNLPHSRARPRVPNTISSDLPFGWRLCLICDNGEKRNKKNADDILRTLEREDRVPIWKRALSVGDYLFIMQKGDRNMVLPLIIERKEVSDLFSSIKDGRFLCQKFRLKKTELANQAYLIEGNLANSAGPGRGTQNVEGTLDFSIKICYAEGFHVFQTKDRRDTAKKLKTLFLSLRDHIHKNYSSSENALLEFCKNKNLNQFQEEYTRKACTRAQTARHRFGQMLMGIKGVNSTIAEKITEKYPTLRNNHFLIKIGSHPTKVHVLNSWFSFILP